MVVFYNPYLYTGGAETLIYRIALELQTRGTATKVVCQGCSDIMRKLFLDSNICIVENQDCRGAVGKNYTVVVFSLLDYIKLKLISVGKNVKVILYMVGLNTLTVQKLQRYPVLLRIFKPCISRYITDAIHKDNIIFMDRLGVNATERFYHVDYHLKAEDLFPLPVSTYPLQDEFCEKLARERQCFSILSIARADFPFKGYLRGLIEVCTDLSKKYPIQLTIVSYGADIDRLLGWIDIAKKNGFTDITLIGETPYHTLTKYILQSNLYIGMGTTVLDAASRGIISIAVQSGTYKLNAAHLFDEEPDRIGGDPDEMMCDALPIIERVINMTDNEYIDTMKKTEKALREMYSMDSFMERFLIITNEKNI